jgi:Flp pilus assembly protein TadD
VTDMTPTEAQAVDVYELYRSAEQHLAEGAVKQAIRDLEQAAEAEPTSPAIQRLLARAYFKSAALRRAEDAARNVVTADPTDAHTTHLLGRCLLRQGRPDEATGWLRLAAAMDPSLEFKAARQPVSDDSDLLDFNIQVIPAE